MKYSYFYYPFVHLVEHEIFYEFLLGVFAKLRKATTSFVMSVRLSAWNDSAPLLDFHEMRYL
jgi:hypothetical protein